MNGLEHYTEAERLATAAHAYEGLPSEKHVQLARVAQVHATLAAVWAHNRATTELIGVLNTLLDQIREAREAQS